MHDDTRGSYLGLEPLKMCLDVSKLLCVQIFFYFITCKSNTRRFYIYISINIIMETTTVPRLLLEGSFIPGQSPTIPRMVTYHSQDGHPPYLEWSPTIPRTVTPIPRRLTHLLKDGHISSTKTVTHHSQHDHPPSPDYRPLAGLFLR